MTVPSEHRLLMVLPNDRDPRAKAVMYGQVAAAVNINSQMHRIPAAFFAASMEGHIRDLRAALQGMEGAA